MCNKLLQNYACGHSKSICTTPCVHALKPSQATTTKLDTSPAKVTHSNSTVSSISPAERPVSTNYSRLHPQSPLRVVNTPSLQTSPAHIPAIRFVPPSRPSTTTPVSPLSLSFTGSAPLSRFPSLSHPAVEVNLEPTFCSYYIPRYLITSKYPYVDCYGKNEWEAFWARWMENYRLGHPLDRGEDVGEDVGVFSGVSGVIERSG